MPIISVTLGIDQVTKEQKKNLIGRFTETAVEITGLPEPAFTILINELPDTNIGLGGRTLDEVKHSMAR